MGAHWFTDFASVCSGIRGDGGPSVLELSITELQGAGLGKDVRLPLAGPAQGDTGT